MKASEALLIATKTIDVEVLNGIFSIVREAAEAGQTEVTINKIYPTVVLSGLEAFGYQVVSSFYDAAETMGTTRICWRYAND